MPTPQPLALVADRGPGAEAPGAGGAGGAGPSLIWRWLGIWLLSRLVIASVIVGSAWSGGVGEAERARSLGAWLVSRFAHWDSDLYAAVAHRGYAAEGPASHYNAFFPGLPALMKAWTLLTGGTEQAGGLLVVTVVGPVAALGLGQLALQVTRSRTAATWAVALLAWSPSTVFLSAVLTEAIFLSLVLWAWVFALRRRWVLAGLLVGVSCLFRMNGLFVLFGLLVLFVIQRWREGRRPGPDLLPGLVALGVGPALVACWGFYLWRLTGHWNAWTLAQQVGWGRHMASPGVGLHDWSARLAASQWWHLKLSRLMDLAAFVIAPVAAVVYASRRNWAVAAFCGISSVPIVFSSLLEGGARYMVVWFPLYISAAAVLARLPRWVGAAVLALSALGAVVVAYCWGNEFWIA